MQIFTHDFLADVERLTDAALGAESDLKRIGAILVTIDALALTVPGFPPTVLAPTFAPLAAKYSVLLERMRTVASHEATHAQRS